MHYWGYMWLEVKGQWGLLLPPCLLIIAVQQPGTSGPPSWSKRSSEGVIEMYRASFTNSSCPLPWSSTDVSSQLIGWWFSHACSTHSQLLRHSFPHHCFVCLYITNANWRHVSKVMVLSRTLLVPAMSKDSPSVPQCVLMLLKAPTIGGSMFYFTALPVKDCVGMSPK